MRKPWWILLGLGILAAGTTAAAHHAFAAEFDKDRPIKLRGTVTKMQWINRSEEHTSELQSQR